MPMELKVVYRALRQISRWTVGGFYEEVYVDGIENIPKDGPLIIACTHHNEMIDIATLSITIPYSRHLSFWAKSSMFKNPVTAIILSSSGAIPVQRIPNSTNGTQQAHALLFTSTIHALARSDAIGVFPEGTSYTEPCIVQVKDGASWAGVEYVKWRVEQEKLGREAGKDELVIVPTAIVYTDKSSYRSRVLVRYGAPIRISTSSPSFLEGDYRTVVKNTTTSIEKAMIGLSINAPDWNTLYAARMARNILFRDEKSVRLKDFVDVEQTLINTFTTKPNSPTSLPVLKSSLIKYYSLLHYTSTTHASLPASILSSPSLLYLFFHHNISCLSQLHPSTLLFLPVLPFFLPAYVLGMFAGRYLATKGEEEGQAQFKGIFGGFGIGIGAAAAAVGVVKGLIRYSRGTFDWAQSFLPDYALRDSLVRRVVDHLSLTTKNIGSVLDGGAGKTRKIINTIGVVYFTAWLLIRWHNALVDINYRRFKTITTSYKLLISHLIPSFFSFPPSPSLFSASSKPLITLPAIDPLLPYLTPPHPAINPYIAHTFASELPPKVEGAGAGIGGWRLMRALLHAKIEAEKRLGEYLVDIELDGEGEEKAGIEMLKKMGTNV